MVDSFEELNLNPDLLRGIYGKPPFTQLSAFKSHPSFNKRVLSLSSAKRTPLLKLNQGQVKLQPFPLVSFNSSTLSHLNARLLFLHQQENSHNKLTKLFSVSVSLLKSIQDVVLVALIPEKIEKL